MDDELTDLLDVKVVGNDDGEPGALMLRCQHCAAVLCDVEHDDTLYGLVSMARDHLTEAHTG